MGPDTAYIFSADFLSMPVILCAIYAGRLPICSGQAQINSNAIELVQSQYRAPQKPSRNWSNRKERVLLSAGSYELSGRRFSQGLPPEPPVRTPVHRNRAERTTCCPKSVPISQATDPLAFYSRVQALKEAEEHSFEHRAIGLQISALVERDCRVNSRVFMLLALAASGQREQAAEGSQGACGELRSAVAA